MFFKNVFGIALLFLLAAPICLVAQENVPLNSISPMLDFTLQAADAAYFTVQDPDGSDGAPEGEDEASKEAREALLEAYREILGPDDMLLEAYLEGGKGIIVIDDFWSTTEDYDYMFAQSRIEIDLSVLIKDRGMAWGVLTLRKRLLQSLNWDRKVRNHYIELLLARDPQRAERILNSIRWDAVQALMVEIETIVDRIGEGAEIIISFTDAGDIAVTIKDLGNPDTPVVTKIFTAGAGMLPIVPGKVGKWIGDKINSGAKWVWRKISGKWRKAPKNAAQVSSGKFDYLFGNARGAKNAAHNAPRTAQNLEQMRRLGFFDDAASRKLLQSHFDDVVNDASNITKSYTNKYGTFEVRESLFAGPSGQFAKFESTWEVLADGTRRLTTVIPFGGR